MQPDEVRNMTQNISDIENADTEIEDNDTDIENADTEIINNETDIENADIILG